MSDTHIRALPVHQPWASLLVRGSKLVETRSYPPSRLSLRPGDRIAIHATKDRRGLAACEDGFIAARIADPGTLPLGAIVGTAVLDRASQMTEETITRLAIEQPAEYAFGLYQPGRWAWVFRDAEPLPTPVPFVGQRGSFDVPRDLLDLPDEPKAQEGTVYVDELPASGWGKWNSGAHMMANDLDALHAMAERIGLQRSWFQANSRFAHYDLTASKRSKAVRAGAVAITLGEIPDDVLMRGDDGAYERRCDRHAMEVRA